jgi:hypothetical protein
MVPVCTGFVPQNEGDVGPRINMYPWNGVIRAQVATWM